MRKDLEDLPRKYWNAQVSAEPAAAAGGNYHLEGPEKVAIEQNPTHSKTRTTFYGQRPAEDESL